MIKDEEKEEEGDKPRKSDGTRTSKNKDDDEEDDEKQTKAFNKYSTIAHLANATVVAEPPPMLARFMFRKSVSRLNTEVSFTFN